MKCDVCKARESTVHLTEVVNDKITKLHLCEHCAKSKSKEMQSHFGLTDLLSGLMDFGPSIDESKLQTTDLDVSCDICGMTYLDFQKTGRLGCGECYKKFSKNLSELLKTIHGSDRHIGKTPFVRKKSAKEQEDITRLKKELNELVHTEEFEKAAVLRDRIKDIETNV